MLVDRGDRPQGMTNNHVYHNGKWWWRDEWEKLERQRELGVDVREYFGPHVFTDL